MAKAASNTVPHTLIKGLTTSIGTNNFVEEETVLRAYAAVCKPALRRWLLALLASCRRLHALNLERTALA